MDQLVKLLKTAVREGQTAHTNAVETTTGDGDTRMVHTVVPILDDKGTTVDRLFIYSERPE